MWGRFIFAPLFATYFQEPVGNVLSTIPFVGALFSPSQNLPNYGILPGPQTYCGLSKVGKTYLYVSPGLGDNDGLYPPPFFRFFNPPTISLIFLTTSRL